MLALILAVAIGYGTTLLPPVAYVALGIAAFGATFMLKGRAYVLWGITALYLTVIFWLPRLLNPGGFALRVDDVLFVILLGDSVMRLIRVPEMRSAAVPLIRMMVPVGVFLTYIGLTLFTVARSHPSELTMALASFLRVVAVSLYVVIAFTTFTNEDRLWRFLWLLAFLYGLTVLVGGYEFLSSGGFAYEQRVVAFLGPNQLGIVSGLLVVFALVQFRHGLFTSRIVPYLCIGLGFAGFFLSRSMGSILATLATIFLYQITHMRRDMLSVIRLLVGLAVAAFAFVALLFMLRTAPTQSFVALRGGGSFIQRLIMAETGWEIFKQHPLWGVGWMMSGRPEVYTDSEVARTLRSRFPEVAATIFPDVLDRAEVHNMYIQFLAELGLAGTLVFVWLFFQIALVVRAILRQSARSVLSRACAEYCTLGVVFILVWWNTNPLYGGQLESFLCFIFLGALAAIPNILRHSTAGLTPGTAVS